LLASGACETPGKESPRRSRAPLSSYIPKITDFGLARRPVEGDSSDVELQGELPCYLAPEQAWGRAKDIGPATDVYALGAIFYELISGRPPFREATVTETLDAIQTREPLPLSRFRSGMSRDLEAICRKCLAKQPRRRYASALALAEDLRRFADGVPVKARVPGNAERFAKCLRRNTRGVALVLLGLVVGVTMAALLGSATPSSSQTDRFRDQNYRHAIGRTEADYQRRISQLELEVREARNNQNYIRDLLLAQRALAAGDKEQARKMLERCSLGRQWEWDYLSGHLEEKNQVSEFRADSPILCMVLNDDFLVAGGGKESVDDPRGETGEVAIWDIKSRQRLWHGEFDEPVRSVSFCDNGLALVSSSRQRGRFGSLQVRSLARNDPKNVGKLVFRPYQFKDCRPTSVTGDRNLLVASDDGKLHLVDTTLGRSLLKRDVFFRQITPRGPHARLRQLDPNLFAFIRPDGNQMVLLPELYGQSMPIELPGGIGTTFLDLAYDNRSDLLAAAALDGSIRLWSAHFPNQEPRVLGGHKGRVTSVSFSIDGQRLASCGNDGTVRIWDVKEGIELLTLPGYPSAANVILQSPPGWSVGAPANPATIDWRATGPLAVAHGNKVTVILPAPIKVWLRAE
jgi:hypothetical protein